MYTTFYSMSCNPFLKEVDTKKRYESNDYKQMISRFNYLKEIRGIGIFTSSPGLGKTYTTRCFVDSVSKDLYKIIYISAMDTLSVFDFLKTIADAFHIDVGACYKTDIYKRIQKEIIKTVEQDKVIPIFIIDDAHNLSRDIIQNLKLLYDFNMDSKDYVMLILMGQNELKDELSKNIYESLKQRIIVNYRMKGLSRQEVKEYVETRLKIADVNNKIFTDDALNALYSCSKSSPRRLNNLIMNCLIIGYQNKMYTIDSEVVMEAKEEMDLV